MISPAVPAVPAVPAEPASNLAQGAWVSHEWANQPYFTLITIFIFAPYFATAVVGDAVAGQAVWGYIQATAGVIIAVLSPILGAIADASGRRKPWIAVFVTICVLSCIGLWWATPGADILPIAALLILAAIGMEFTIAFINAILPGIASERRMGLLSGLGIGVGQLAGIVSLALVFAGFHLFDEPLFGLSAQSHQSDRITGPLSGLWLAVFILPLFLFIRDVPSRGLSMTAIVGDGIGRLRTTFSEVRHYRNVALFLVGRMIYYDGMNAVFVFGGIIAATSFQWGVLELAVFGILSSLAAALGAFVGGVVDRRVGSRTTVLGALMLCFVMIIVMVSFDHDRILFVRIALPDGDPGPFGTWPEILFTASTMVFATGVGPVIASSRTLMARLAPVEKMTEFFGLYALSGKATTFLAPLIIATITSVSGSQRLGLAVALPFICIGGFILLRVREERARIAA